MILWFQTVIWRYVPPLDISDLLQRSFDTEPMNPKLVKLEEVIAQSLLQGENARGIIFVKTRALVKALVCWMQESKTLSCLNATEFVGQTVSAKQGGEYMLDISTSNCYNLVIPSHSPFGVLLKTFPCNFTSYVH